MGVCAHVAFHLQRTLSILKDREDVSICLKSARAISGSLVVKYAKVLLRLIVKSIFLAKASQR